MYVPNHRGRKEAAGMARPKARAARGRAAREGAAREPEAGAADARDGRLVRSERSREAIVDAMLALVGEGDPSPTADRIAERARVGIRTVFRHFRDMEGLFTAMDSRIEAAVAPGFAAPSDTSAGRDERARELVERRCRLYEAIAPYKRAGALRRPTSPFLRGRHATLVRRLRADLRRSLPELDAAPAELAEALELVTSFEAWDQLRSDQRLGAARARAVMERSVLALLG
jgi:AcrR family transcriptional regulator